MDTNQTSESTRWGWGAPLISTLLALHSACIMPGKTPAIGNAGEELASCGADGLIDDGEDNNSQGKVIAGRGGYWYTFADAAGTTVVAEIGEPSGGFTMSPGGVNGSKYAANMHGHVGQGSVVYGGMGVNLTDPRNMYDASRYKGVAFWAKKGAGSYGRVRFKVPDTSTDKAGGVCTDCSNDFGANLLLTESWQHFVFPWRKLKQLPDWGSPRPRVIKSNRIYGLQWQVIQPGADFDVWVDDLEFIGCE